MWRGHWQETRIQTPACQGTLATAAGAEVAGPAGRLGPPLGAGQKLQSCGDLGAAAPPLLWAAQSGFSWRHHWAPRGHFRAIRNYPHPLALENA